MTSMLATRKDWYKTVGYALDYVPECITIEQWRRMQAKVDHPITYKPQHQAAIGTQGVDAPPPMGTPSGRARVAGSQSGTPRPAVWNREKGYKS